MCSLAFVFIINISCTQQKIEGLSYIDGKLISVELKNGKIVKVKSIEKLSEGSEELIIAPEFFDNQVNGFAGVSFSLGGSDLTKEGIVKATSELWKKGVTTYLPTLTTNSQKVLVENFAILAKSLEDEKLLGSIPGFHLEGPYINPEDGYHGAHSKQFVLRILTITNLHILKSLILNKKY